MTLKLPPGVEWPGVEDGVISTSQWPIENEDEFLTISDQLKGDDLGDEDS